MNEFEHSKQKVTWLPTKHFGALKKSSENVVRC